MSRISTASRAWALGGGDFWRLWYAGLTAFLVRWMETLAVSIFVFQRTGSPFAVAMMTMLRLLPMGLFGAFLGAWADRIERRTGLIGVILLLAITDAVLAALAATGRLTVWEVAIGSFVNGIGWATDNPVRRAAMGEAVGADRMGTAMSVDVAANNGTRMAGPAIGGALLATVGIEGVFAAGAALYLTSLFAAVSLEQRRRSAATLSKSVLAGIAEGLRFARHDRRLTATLIVTVIYNLFAWPFTSMVPVIAQDNLHLGTAATGVLASMDGVGAFLGAMAIGLAAPRRHYGRLYVGGMTIYAAMVIGFALSPGPVPAGIALALEGIGGAGYSVLQATLVYQYAPPEMRSRLLGLLSVCIGVGPIGFVHLGLLANAVGAQWATAITGIEGLIALALTRPLWGTLTSR